MKGAAALVMSWSAQLACAMTHVCTWQQQLHSHWHQTEQVRSKADAAWVAQHNTQQPSLHLAGFCKLWMLLADTGKALSIDDMSDRRDAVSGMIPKVLLTHNPLQIPLQSV